MTYPIRNPERTKEAILIAAERLISEKGVQALTLDEVAARASLSKGGLLHHFASKRALMNGLAERMIALHEADINDFEQKDPASPGSYTRAFMRASLACADECTQVCATLSAESKSFPEMLDLFRVYSANCDRRLETDGLDPAVASVVRYAAEGLMSAATWGMPRPANYDVVVEYLLALASGKKKKKS